MLIEPGSWFAIQVVSRMEMKVAMGLEQKGYRHFVPTCRSSYKSSTQNKTVELPLFPGYVFCRIEGNVSGLVLSTPGVLRVVSFGGKPAPIASEELENIRRVVLSGMGTSPCNFLRVGQRVRVIDGILAGLSGILVQTKSQRRVVISVETVMKSMSVDIDESRVALCEKKEIAA